jgi:hypothetical protein
MARDRKPADRMKQGLTPSKNSKASQFKKKGDFRIGGTYSTGRAITIGIPGQKPKVKGKAVASKGQAMRKADKADASKRRISGTTRGGRSKY